MATTTEIPQNITTLFTNLEEQKTLLTKCTDLYKTLTSHFTTLQESLNSQSQTLDSKLETLDSSFEETLDSIKSREDSLPELFDSLSSAVETQKAAALSEMENPIPGDSAGLSEVLRSVCRRMDQRLLIKVLVGKRRESTVLRAEMTEALTDCVDRERFVVEAVREFVEMKREKRVGLTDKRWACSMLVGSLFPAEELKEGRKGKGLVGRVFAKKSVERAVEVLKEWKEVSDSNVGGGEGGEGGGGGSGMGPAEAAMFLEVVLGFGLKEMFEEEFYRKLMLEFCGRRDMAKLAVPILGDKLAGYIEELVNNGNEVEAVYFASESGLTEKFQPVSLLKSALRKSKKNVGDVLRKGNHSSASTDEANSLEISSIRPIIKCVEDHKIEAQFPIDNLKKRLATLEKLKAERKKGSAASSSKRPRAAGVDRTSGPSSHRPSKVPKHSSPYAAFPARDKVSTASRLSPVSRYLSPYSYPTQTQTQTQSTYDSGLTASAYVPTQSYAGSHIPAAAPAAAAGAGQVTQHYFMPSDSAAAAGARHGTAGSTYGAQVGYVSYDYSAAATHAYQPTYPQ